MADNEKLLEAARMIKRHCKETGRDKPCCFAFDGICKGIENCTIGDYDLFPCDWNVKNRWTTSDVSMAVALRSVGYVRIKEKNCHRQIFAENERGGEWHVPSGLFTAINSNETVQLSDIIAEGAEQ